MVRTQVADAVITKELKEGTRQSRGFCSMRGIDLYYIGLKGDIYTGQALRGAEVGDGIGVIAGAGVPFPIRPLEWGVICTDFLLISPS